MSLQHIVIRGAREHNLKNVDVEIPRNQLTVVTGLSGSGKSSLAFDTLYAEGQRKYVESLSAYARQFLEQMQKPDCDHVEGLSPAISIEQRVAGSNPRSIVATTTEIHDYLRLLYASIGHPHCPSCGKPVGRQSAEQIVEQLLALPEGTRLMLMAPLVRGRKGKHEEVFRSVQKQGFARVRVDGEVYPIEEPPKLHKNYKHTIEAVVDRLVLAPDLRSRMTDSVELALRTGEGLLVASCEISKGTWSDTVYSESNACVDCGLSFEDLTPRHFSFNSPYGACPVCAGLGTMQIFDPDLVVPDKAATLDKHAIRPWKGAGRRATMYYKKLLRSIVASYGQSMSSRWSDLPEAFQKVLLYGTGDEEIEFRMWHAGANRVYRKPFEGVLPNLQRRYEDTESDHVRAHLRRYMSRRHCTACDGHRLRPFSLACTVSGLSIYDAIRQSVSDARIFFQELELCPQEQHIAAEPLKEICERLGFLENVGLGYLTLDRESGTLSGGEAQRIRLATQVGAGLVGVLYVLDEPSIGLHQRDNQRLINTLIGLRDLGNTVVVVEHDEQTIRCADYVIDLGPGAGRHGGEVVYAGPGHQLEAKATSLTADYLSGRKFVPIPKKRIKPGKQKLKIRGASGNNLKNINVDIPLGLFVCVTGVSGSGKSTLVDDLLRRALFQHFYHSRECPGPHKSITGMEHLDKVIVIDQSPIGRTPRSNPATYTGAFTLIRTFYTQLPAAKVRGYKPGRFSFNVKGGRCETCKGDGMLKIEMHFLPDVYVPCEQCQGQRYNRETLEVKYKGKSIADVLNMTIDEALEFFDTHPVISRKLRTLSEVGLGYVHVGQSATTLSGGEAQRMKLSAELSKRATGNTLYILDEPTTGLHFADVQRLLDVLLRLRDQGNTILVIEHNLDVIKTADHLIDLGPEGGDAGGTVVVTGPPEKVARQAGSYTGQYLKEVLDP